MSKSIRYVVKQILADIKLRSAQYRIVFYDAAKISQLERERLEQQEILLEQASLLKQRMERIDQLRKVVRLRDEQIEALTSERPEKSDSAIDHA